MLHLYWVVQLIPSLLRYLSAFHLLKSNRFFRCQEEEEKQATKRALSHAATKPPAPAWGPQDSAELYNVAGWGAPYFHVSDRGLLAVRPHGDGASSAL